VRQLTLVAFWGAKTPALAARIHGLQDRLTSALGARFRPYTLEQVHATLVGLNRTEAGGLWNACFARERGERRWMDVAALSARLLAGAELPVGLRFGAYRAGERPFASRARTPYERSFSFQGTKAVLIGWPAPDRSGAVSLAIDALRRAAQDAGVLHTYHREPDDVDNDVYLRLGLVETPLDPDVARPLEERVRRELAEAPPLLLALAADDLLLASYDDETLPTGSTRTVPLLGGALDEASVLALLRD
jgi:hypothetical protein